MKKRRTPKLPRKRDLREVIVAETRVRMDRYGLAKRSTGGCLYWAATVVAVAHQHRLRLIPQAGMACWARVPPELDDGVMNTHFSYEWQGLGDDLTRSRIAQGLLPEVHVWAADPKRLEIVDLTTGFQAEQCLRMTGEPWLTPPLPAYVWTGKDGLPEGTIYRPDRDATEMAVQLMVKLGLFSS